VGVGNEATVNKIKIQDNFITLILSSHNTDYLPQIIDMEMEKEDVEIIGKVIGSVKYYI